MDLFFYIHMEYSYCSKCQKWHSKYDDCIDDKGTVDLRYNKD